jgi:hypothetical protein
LDGADSTFNKINSLVDNRGSFSILVGRDFSATGLFTNSGVVTIGVDSTFTASGGFIQTATAELYGVGNLGGNVQNAGTVHPGTSAGVLTVDGAFVQQSTGRLAIEIGGYSKGSQYDSLAVSGVAILNGILDVSLLDLAGGMFAPQAGDSFEILTAGGGVLGVFTSLLLPSLSGGLLWQELQYGPNSIVLSIGGIQGDFNYDSVVDAADYVVWRKNGAAQAEFNSWRAHFGQTAGSGAGPNTNATVPEPATAVMFIVGILAMRCRRGKDVS